MKKLALAIALSASATAVQAQIVSKSFSGNLNVLSTASAFQSDGAWGLADVQTSSLNYVVDLIYNFGLSAVISMDVSLDGAFGNVGSSIVPPFAQQTWTLTNAKYAIDPGSFTLIQSGFGSGFTTLVGEFETNGGTMAPLAAGSSGMLTSGSAVCAGGSCGSFDPNILLSGLALNFVLDPATDFGEISASFAVEFTSTSGNTGYAMSAVPVPAAAWLFGSALAGLAGISRKRKMA